MVLETAQPESTKEVVKEQLESDSLDLPNVDDGKIAKEMGARDEEAESKGIEPIITESTAQPDSPSQHGEGELFNCNTLRKVSHTLQFDSATYVSQS